MGSKISNELVALLINLLPGHYADFTQETELENILGFDSMVHINFVLEAEKLYSIAIDPEEYTSFFSIREFSDLIDNKLTDQ
jgi:acyl carrier protein